MFCIWVLLLLSKLWNVLFLIDIFRNEGLIQNTTKNFYICFCHCWIVKCKISKGFCKMVLHEQVLCLFVFWQLSKDPVNSWYSKMLNLRKTKMLWEYFYRGFISKLCISLAIMHEVASVWLWCAEKHWGKSCDCQQ